MKTEAPIRTIRALCLAAVALALPAPAEEGAAAPAPASFAPTRSIEMRPDEKRSLVLRPDERNPYARRSVDEERLLDTKENAEEVEIRSRLSSLSVTGRSRGANGLRLLLGDIILERGRVLPQLLEEQSEQLQVVEVTDETVVLGWLDPETGLPTGKTMQLGYDLSPAVAYALQGQGDDPPAAPGGVARRPMGVLRSGSRPGEVAAGDSKASDATDAEADPGLTAGNPAHEPGESGEPER